jgi:hypothetical protein
MAGCFAPRKPSTLPKYAGGKDQAVAATFFASRLRATSALAAAPNSRTMGGAGTSAGGPPVDPVAPLDVLVVPDELVIPLDVLHPALDDP